jgi:CheY-like chemotaxis protein
LSGIELLRRVREEPRLYGLPVVIMTGSLNPKDAEICARLGITAYLSKPVSLSIFQKIVDTGKTRRAFLPRAIDPHFSDVAMLH